MAFRSKSSGLSRGLIHILLIFWVGLPLIATMTGCSGCRDPLAKKKTEDEERKEDELADKKEKPKPDFEPMRASILPGSLPIDEDEETFDGTEDPDAEKKTKVEKEDPTLARSFRPIFAKHGHWVHVRYETKANNFDFKGELHSQCVDRNLLPIDLEKSPFSVTCARPAALAKGQMKEIEIPVFINVPADRNSRTVQVLSRLRTRTSGREVIGDIAPTMRLKPHQYHFVVLAKNPDSYGFLRASETIKPPFDEWALDGKQETYIVTMHGYEEGALMPLPTNALAWTSIAYMIWDDLPPDALDVEQQEALLDWIHWGGQLLVSGPRSLDSLRASFLADYLPAKTQKARPMTNEELSTVNSNWSLTPDAIDFDPAMYQLGGKDKAKPLEITPLDPIAPARPVQTTAGLVVERNVGRGRIVATAFPLSGRRFVNWQNYDGFLNGCLMRRPARRYRNGSNGFGTVSWADRKLTNSKDPRLSSRLRYFSRDLAIPGESGKRASQARRGDVVSVAGQGIDLGREESARRERQEQKDIAEKSRSAEGEARQAVWGFVVSPAPESEPRLFGTSTNSDSGVAGWSDFTAISHAARSSLQQAAGISIPNSEFVFKILLGYLVCLVPVNWMLFKLVRRVEWAWFAAPLIAILGAVGVVKMAQLDIGFVRSRTEIAVVEMQPEYDRAHVTRYCGVYSSLTSDYSVEFEDEDALALPFSTDPEPSQLVQQRRQRKEVSYRRDKKVGLKGYPVISNTTGMLHVEQMMDPGGKIVLSDDAAADSDLQITNSTAWPLKSAMAVRRTGSDLEIALIGEMPTGEQVKLKFEPVRDGQSVFDFLDRNPTTSRTTAEGDVSLHDLYRIGVHSSQLAEDDIRFVAWTDQEVDGMTISPTSSQQTFRTFVVSHLKYALAGEPQVDLNHYADFRRDPNEDEPEIE